MVIGIIVVAAVIVAVAWYFMRSTPALAPTVEQEMPADLTGESGVEEMVVGEEESGPATGEVQEFNIAGKDLKYSISEIRVKQGDTVRINFSSQDMMHDWRLDEFGAATKVLPAGQSETIEFIANKAGEYEYYCSVGNHRQMGMVGALIVE